MAVATPTILTEGNGTTPGTVFQTASVTPKANTLYLLFVTSGLSAAAASPTITSGGMTWTQINTVAVASVNIRATAYWGRGAAPTAGAITMTYGVSHTLSEWHVVEILNAQDVVQSALLTSSTVNGTPVTATLAALKAGSASLGYWVCNSNSGVWTPTDTRLGTDNAVSSPAMEDMVEYKVAGSTAVSASYNSASTKVGIGIEVSDYQRGKPGRAALQAVNRGASW